MDQFITTTTPLAQEDLTIQTGELSSLIQVNENQDQGLNLALLQSNEETTEVLFEGPEDIALGNRQLAGTYFSDNVANPRGHIVYQQAGGKFSVYGAEQAGYRWYWDASSCGSRIIFDREYTYERGGVTSRNMMFNIASPGWTPTICYMKFKLDQPGHHYYDWYKTPDTQMPLDFK